MATTDTNCTRPGWRARGTPYIGFSSRVRHPTTMASTSQRSGPANHASTHEKLLKEEEMLEKVQDFAKLIRSWELGKAMCQELEKQEERCFARSRKRQQGEKKEELHFANKQLMMVRRAALRRLLSIEQLEYQLELNHLGKSFYAERL